MFGIRQAVRRRTREEGEKPFWISFSDLMSALMVLFLLAMTVALLAVTNEISESERQKTEREREILGLLDRLRAATDAFPGLTIGGASIDFGERARFETNSHKLNAEQAQLLRDFTPELLAIARDPAGEKWLKRVVVEGFADARGSYMHNLNLSLQRSERVLCVLLAPPGSAAGTLSDSERQQVRDLFFVGGASFNALKNSPEESRRIELRLEFLDPAERRVNAPQPPLDDDPRCPIDRP
ncbi:MAG: OmpA family protein [Rhodocyclaceae bacterium]